MNMVFIARLLSHEGHVGVDDRTRSSTNLGEARGERQAVGHEHGRAMGAALEMERARCEEAAVHNGSRIPRPETATPAKSVMRLFSTANTMRPPSMHTM